MDLQFVMTNPGTETNQFMSNLHLTPSEPHPTVGNPEDDQSMSDLLLTSSHTHSTLGDLENWVLSMLNDSGDGGVKDADDLPSPSKIPVEGIPSPGLAADAAAGAEIGQPASGSREVGGDRFLPSAGAPHVAVGNELPPGHGSHVQMEGDQSLAHARCCTDISTDRVGAVPETGSLEGDGSRGPLELPVGHVASSSSATGPDYLHLKSAEGFIQPDTGTYEVGNPGPSTSRTAEEIPTSEFSIDLLFKKKFSINFLEEVAFLRELLENRFYFGDLKLLHRLVHPQKPPTSQQRYITKFEPKLDDGDKKAGYWKEKEAKAIRDASASRNIVGLKRTLEYMKGNKRTHWLADEYVALEPAGHDAWHILVRTHPH